MKKDYYTTNHFVGANLSTIISLSKILGVKLYENIKPYPTRLSHWFIWEDIRWEFIDTNLG